MASYTGGSKATSRIQALEAERKRNKDELARRKERIAAASDKVISNATGNSFTASTETVEDLLKSDTVGLVTHADFKARRKYLERYKTLREKQADERRARLKKANKVVLSFAESDDSDDNSEDDSELPQKKRKVLQRTEEDESEVKGVPPSPPKRRKLGKSPGVDTSFLPDREREINEQRERERLKQDWINEQEAIKSEIVRITYSYWDGSGHRRTIRCKKGTTVGRFLAMVQTEFKELRNTSADTLMFIKEDLIIPHHYSFYDFIVTKARGKSGPLFSFDVVEDIRVVTDTKKEKEDAHAGKVVERRWYERNRHIFPASRWEVYDPTKNFSRYTIHGD
ncbi:unnamed protein product [Chondrus crispus]|uniref:FAM50A/XAP5 C-terminal domain-containing protein n=1 Tax=Chondrus crispus TaxID=2769 RepID=R7QE63_CHOCR|nr:unnamed protein product [Chondrus crispus]CDF36028.1 unnamed protein product [Chondrus crispus]|eukprot:XP_005715847.1 unnamed protein product [Chondrus crispus]